MISQIIQKVFGLTSKRGLKQDLLSLFNILWCVITVFCLALYFVLNLLLFGLQSNIYLGVSAVFAVASFVILRYLDKFILLNYINNIPVINKDYAKDNAHHQQGGKK